MWRPTRKSLKIVAWVWATQCWLLTWQSGLLLRPPRHQATSQTIIAARRQTWTVRRAKMAAVAVWQRPPTVIQTAAAETPAATRMAILTMTTMPIWKAFVKALRLRAPPSTLGELHGPWGSWFLYYKKSAFALKLHDHFLRNSFIQLFLTKVLVAFLAIIPGSRRWSSVANIRLSLTTTMQSTVSCTPSWRRCLDDLPSWRKNCAMKNIMIRSTR